MCLLQKKKKNRIFPGQEARLRFATQPSRCITSDNFALLSSPRCHQGRRLGSDEDVHATSQHRGKITPLHQVSVIGVFCLFFFSPLSLQFSLLCYLGEDYRSTFLSRCHSSLSAFVPWKQIYLLLSLLPLLSAVQCSYGRPGDAAPGQDRGMEEDG